MYDGLTAEMASLCVQIENLRSEGEREQHSHKAQLKEMERTLAAVQAQSGLDIDALQPCFKCKESDMSVFMERVDEC